MSIEERAAARMETVVSRMETRPRLVFALDVLLLIVRGALTIVLFSALGVLAGAVTAFSVFAAWAAVTTSGPQVDLAPWIGLVYVFMALGGLIGLFLAARDLQSSDPDSRPRRARVRSAVRQAIVAHGLGLSVGRLRIGLEQGWSVRTGIPVDLREQDWQEVFFRSGSDQLALLLAGVLQLRGEDADWDFALPTEAMDEFTSRVTSVADKTVVRQVVHQDGEVVDRDRLIVEAAERARRLVEEVPYRTLDALEEELRTAGVMRGKRFVQILERGQAEAQSEDPQTLRVVRALPSSD